MSITVVIPVILFLVQRRGTAGIGAAFGPVVLIWFAVLGILGIRGIILHPGVLAAIDLSYAVAFFADNGFAGFVVLGTLVAVRWDWHPILVVVLALIALTIDLAFFGANTLKIR